MVVGVHAWVHGYQVRVCSNEIDGVLACCWVSGATLCVPCCGIPLLVDHLLWWLAGVGCVLCENCIVDASILFFLCNFCLLSCLQFFVATVIVVLCYGRMVDALACWADEGRVRLR